MIVPNQFKPKKKGVSDKFSWNLYRFLREYPNAKIMLYKKDHTGDIKEFDPNGFQGTYHFFGMIGELVGARFVDIMRAGPSAKIQLYAFSWWGDANFIDVTDWFFSEYERRGRCLFDKEHSSWWAGEEGRFTYINSHSRRCNWCGAWQKMRIEKRVRLERKKVWEAS